MPSTEELVKSAKSGELSAFSELVRRYEGTSQLTAWSIVGDFHAAQDVAQDAFVIAYRKLSRLRDAKTFGPWLLTIVKREAWRASQKQVRRHEVGPPVESLACSEGWWQEFKDLLPTLQRLPDQERLVIALRYVDGLSVSEVAAATGRSVGTVTKQISRAIQRLRSLEIEVEK